MCKNKMYCFTSRSSHPNKTMLIKSTVTQESIFHFPFLSTELWWKSRLIAWVIDFIESREWCCRTCEIFTQLPPDLMFDLAVLVHCFHKNSFTTQWPQIKFAMVKYNLTATSQFTSEMLFPAPINIHSRVKWHTKKFKFSTVNFFLVSSCLAGKVFLTLIIYFVFQKSYKQRKVIRICIT